MILYINGDSHSAAGEAVNSYCFAEDDTRYSYMGRAPHPDNLKVSYGAELSKILKAKLICQAESASSNDRIIRTTREFLKQPTNDKPFVIIGWSTWEREEWLHNGTYWQVNLGGVGKDWPAEIKERYRPWIMNIHMKYKMREWNQKIWDFHQELSSQEIKHFFFNTFEDLGVKEDERKDWGNSYLAPYDYDQTYYNWLMSRGFKPVKPGSYHFGPDAHFAWAQHLIKPLTKIL